MALVTGYAVYFSGARTAPEPRDGVSGGSLTLDFDPGFAEHLSRGIVKFPELGKRDGSFFSLEGVSYFVPDNPSGLPIEYEGTVLAVACEDAPAKPQEAEPVAEAPEALENVKAQPAQPAVTAKAPIFFDMPEPGQADRAPAQVAKDAEAPDADLTAMLRSIFEAPQEGDEQEEVPHMEQPVHVTRPTEQPDHVAPPMEEPVPEAQPERVKAPSVAQEEPCAIVPSDWMVEHLGASKPMLSGPELPEHAELPEPLAIAPPATALSAQETDDTDDWAVYFEKVPTPPRMPAQVIEIMPAAAVPAAPAHSRAGTTPQGPQPFDRTIDLVLVGEEKETFEIMAEEIEETVDSFETIKLIDVSPDPEPLLTAELRKLDPNAPDRRSFKLLPWIKRDETEEEMLERLTIKNVKFAG